jgi:hypothetical protein
MQTGTTKTKEEKENCITLKATGDLLVFLILTALLTCLPGSSSKKKKKKKRKINN